MNCRADEREGCNRLYSAAYGFQPTLGRHHVARNVHIVIPAKAGIQQLLCSRAQEKKKGGCFRNLPFRIWCPRRDSNPHTLRHMDLNHARLPIPPRGLKEPKIIETWQKKSIAGATLWRTWPASMIEAFPAHHSYVRYTNAVYSPIFSPIF